MYEQTVAVIEDFESVRLLTLTVSQSEFLGPAEAYLAMRLKVSRLMQELRRAGYLHSGRYFGVIEVHKTGWPHWHVIIDAPDIPHAEITRLWRNHGGGHVWISRGPNGKAFKSKKHAANYALKYLRKEPREGWPAWILDGGLKIRRYLTSQKFYQGGKKRKSPGERQDSEEEEEETEKVDKPKRTHRVRIAACSTKTAVFGVTVEAVGEGAERQYRRRLRHLATLDMRRSEVLSIMGCDPDHSGRWEAPITLLRSGKPSELWRLVREAIARKSGRGEEAEPDQQADWRSEDGGRGPDEWDRWLESLKPASARSPSSQPAEARASSLFGL